MTDSISNTHLADAAPKVSVAGCHDVAFVLPDALADTVVGVRAGVHARQHLQPWVLWCAHESRVVQTDEPSSSTMRTAPS